jgi:site-specific DNA recombinase
MRVIGYARLSRSTEESTSIARQHEVIADVARRRGHELVGIVDDVDVSATKRRLDRPGLDRVRAAIAAGDAEAVIVWRLDRLARSVVDIGTLLDEGMAIVSATEPFDTTTPIGRAMVEIVSVFAAMEAAAISARVRSARAYLPTVGRWRGGPRPYGYRIAPHPDGRGKILEHDPAEAAVVRRIVDEALAGRTLYAIANALNDEGIPSPRGRQWTRQAIAQHLVSDAILGRTRIDGELMRDDAGRPLSLWPPLITPDEAARLRAVVAPGKALPPRRRASALLSGLVRCASCGLNLTHVRPTNGVPRYGCPARERHLTCTEPAQIRSALIEPVVEAEFLRRFGQMEAVEVVRSATDDGMAEVEEAIQETTDAMRHPDADLPALVDRLRALRAERDRIAAAPRADAIRMVPTGRRIREEWELADVDRRRALLADAGADVVLRRARVAGHADPERVVVSFAGDADRGEW